MNNLKINLIYLVLSLTLMACGGGGGNDKDEASEQEIAATKHYLNDKRIIEMDTQSTEDKYLIVNAVAVEPLNLSGSTACWSNSDYYMRMESSIEIEKTCTYHLLGRMQDTATITVDFDSNIEGELFIDTISQTNFPIAADGNDGSPSQPKAVQATANQFGENHFFNWYSMAVPANTRIHFFAYPDGPYGNRASCSRSGGSFNGINNYGFAIFSDLYPEINMRYNCDTHLEITTTDKDATLYFNVRFNTFGYFEVIM